jgi:hypothetical protein
MTKQLLALVFIFTCATGYSQKISYTDCSDCWNADSLGNHRIVLHFAGTGKTAKAIIHWMKMLLQKESL